VRKAADLRRRYAALLEQIRALLAQVQTAAQAFQTSVSAAGPVPGLAEQPTASSVVDFGALRQAGLDLLAAIQHYNQAERDLLFESVSTDIGVGD
jgi:hypothetical protein